MAFIKTPGMRFGEFDRVFSNSEELPDRKSNKANFIYAVKFNSRVKIGVAADPKKRVIQLECGCGEFFNEIYVSEYLEDAKYYESILHAFFQGSRGVGEWFNIPFDAAVEAIRHHEETERKYDDMDLPKYGDSEPNHRDRRWRMEDAKPKDVLDNIPTFIK